MSFGISEDQTTPGSYWWLHGQFRVCNFLNTNTHYKFADFFPGGAGVWAIVGKQNRD